MGTLAPDEIMNVPLDSTAFIADSLAGGKDRPKIRVPH